LLLRWAACAKVFEPPIEGTERWQIFASIKGEAISSPSPMGDRGFVRAGQRTCVAVTNGTLHSLVGVDRVEVYARLKAHSGHPSELSRLIPIRMN
jgi:hypothetical protein